MSQKPQANKPAEVINLFDQADPEEISVARRVRTDPVAAAMSGKAPIDLSGRPKVVFVAGLGATGKTTWVRWAVGEILARNAPARLAAIDPENRELRDFYDDILEPPTHDPAGIASWLKNLLDVSLREKSSALIDTGGGDAALGTLVSRTENLTQVMVENGVHPVAVYPLSPRISDLAPLAALEEAGFQPQATLIILNEGRADSTVPREHAFRTVMRHSVYKAAIDRGAYQVWMPRLYVAKDVEDRRLTFQQARDGIVPEGRKAIPLGVLDRSSVHRWLQQMSVAFAPVMSWLP
jgi:hypothetical protein